MFSVHFPWTNDGPAEVSDQWGRSAAGGWFPASHFYGAATKFGSQAAWKKQEEPDAYKFSRGKHGKPHTSTAFPRFSLSTGAVVPKFWTYHQCATGLSGCCSNRETWCGCGNREGTWKQKNSRCSVQKPIQESDKQSLVKCDQNNVSWILASSTKNPATHINCLGCIYNYIYIYDKQGGSFLVGVRKRLRLYRWATSSEFQHFFPWTGWYHLMLNKYSN